MDPNSFHFNVKLPADTRLIAAVRDLTAHAATYAKLSPDAARTLTDHVVLAAERAIATIYTRGAPIKLRFDASGETVDIDISSEPEPSSELPGSISGDHTDVNWSREGSRQICRIRQRRSA